MMLVDLLAIVSPVEFGGVIVGGVIVLAVVWEKIRPVIIVKSKEGGKFFFGISHSKNRKNMKDLNQKGINGITVNEDSSYGLANTPSKIIKEVGSVTIEKGQELLDSIEQKKITKIEKRKKGIE